MLVLSKPYQEDTIYLWLLATSSMSGTQLGISDTLIAWSMYCRSSMYWQKSRVIGGFSKFSISLQHPLHKLLANFLDTFTVTYIQGLCLLSIATLFWGFWRRIIGYKLEIRCAS